MQSNKEAVMVEHKLLSSIIRNIPSYRMTKDTLYHAGKPLCSLNGLKAVRVADNKVTLEFDDAEPVELMANPDSRGG